MSNNKLATHLPSAVLLKPERRTSAALLRFEQRLTQLSTDPDGNCQLLPRPQVQVKARWLFLGHDAWGQRPNQVYTKVSNIQPFDHVYNV
jgi:hypothetical protein